MKDVDRMLRSGRRLGALAVMVGLGMGWCLAAHGAGLSREGTRLFWDDRPVQLVGYSYYGLVGDRSFDSDAFLDMLAAHNINFTRFFLILPWPVEPGPNRLPFVREHGLYDLNRHDDAFFTRLRRVVTRAEQLGVICQICLFDRCGLSFGDSKAWTNNPFNAACNVNGLLRSEGDGYPAFCQAQGAIADINAAFIRKVVETVGDCSNVIYEIMNEPYPQLGPLAQWHAWAADVIQTNLAGRPGSKVVSSTGAFDQPAIDLFSMHQAGDERRVEAAVRQANAMGVPVVLSDDGDARCMYDPGETLTAAQRALSLGQHFEHLEFTLSLQREVEGRSANTLDRIPAHCLMNLRHLAGLSTPLTDRPYVRETGLEWEGAQVRLKAKLERWKEAVDITGELSNDGGHTWRTIPVSREQGTISTGWLAVERGLRQLARLKFRSLDGRTWTSPVQAFGPRWEWSILLGDPIVEAGLNRVRPNVPDGVIRPTVLAGEPCHEVDRGQRGRFAYFRLGDWFARSARGSRSLVIEVRYFDGPGGGQLVLEYDGEAGAYTAAAPVELEGGGLWRQARFHLNDAAFHGSQNDGADFRLSLKAATRPLAIQRVTVRATRPSEVR